MIYNIIYDENNKPIRLQSVRAYKFEQLLVGMEVYYSKLQKNFKIIRIYKDPKWIYLKGHYGAIIYEYDLFYPTQK